MAISVLASRVSTVPSVLPCHSKAPRSINGACLQRNFNVIECSSRPKKKATSHHMKTRPRKSQPWDINRRPAVYAPLPPLPPDWSLDPNQNQAPALEQTVSSLP